MNERPIEYSYVFRWLNCSPRNVLDVGTGNSPLPAMVAKCGIPIVVAIDSHKPKKPFWPVKVFDVTKSVLRMKFDIITCISVLEHIQHYTTAVLNMSSMLNPGGLLIMTFPYNEKEFIANAYDLPDSKYRWGKNICRQYCVEDLREFEKYHLKLFDKELWCIFDKLYWSCGKRLAKPFKVDNPDIVHHLACVTMVKEK